MGGYTDPDGNWGAWGMTVRVEKIIFVRGKAPDPTVEDWGEYGQILGLAQNYQPYTCTTNCTLVKNPVGCGGVLQLIDGTLNIRNCDFRESFGLIGGALCQIGGTVSIEGDPIVYPPNLAATACESPTVFGSSNPDCTSAPHKLPGLQQHTDYQALLQYEAGTASYCNFERNLAWGATQYKLGGGGAAFVANLHSWSIGNSSTLVLSCCVIQQGTESKRVITTSVILKCDRQRHCALCSDSFD